MRCGGSETRIKEEIERMEVRRQRKEVLKSSVRERNRSCEEEKLVMNGHWLKRLRRE